MANTAELGGTVSLDGGAVITERGVIYALAAVNANPISEGNGVVKVRQAAHPVRSSCL